MQLPETSSEIREVIRRRVHGASDYVQRKAFGSSPVKSAVWREGSLFFLALGSADYLARLVKNERTYGSAFPGVVASDHGFPALMLHLSSRRVGVSTIALDAGPATPIAIGPATTALLFFLGIKFRSGTATVDYRIDCALAWRLEPDLDEHSVADDLDFLLARHLAGYVERVPYAA